MNAQNTENNVRQLLRITAILWLAYWLALAILDTLFYPHPLFTPYYYIINGLNALLVLGLTSWRGVERRLGGAFLPLIIVLMSTLPVLIYQLMVLRLPQSPQGRPEYTALRLMPILLVALILTAWRYSWPVVVGFSLGSAGFMMGVHILFSRPGPAEHTIMPPLTIAVIQLISFLIVGYFINALMRRLREQQHALEAANRQVIHYASTLEHLTISRERNRMARELHDTLAHTLSALSVQLETTKAYWDVDRETAQGLLDQALTATRSGLQETRRALKSLRASPLDDLGLLLGLRKVAEETADRANVRLELTLPERLPALSPDVEQSLYRIAQEAIANVAYHANAHTLRVSLTQENSTLMLCVRDDGIGFDPNSAKVEGHFGLSGMQERARLVGGRLTIQSQPGKGTTLCLTIEG